jgi:hypothetical protein
MHATVRSHHPSPGSVSPAEPDTGPAASGPFPFRQQILLGCGVIGPILFTSVYLADSAARPGYHGWRESISALGVGAGGWVPSVNFIVFGVLSLCFTLGLRRALVSGAAATWAPLLRAAGG